MAEYPAMPLWTDSYLGDTIHLTTIEHGCYLMLLMTMWRSGGSLPNDDKLLARYSRLTPRQWQRIKPIIFPFFKVDGDAVFQPRLRDEFNAVKQRSKVQSDNARAKYRKSLDAAPATAQPNCTIGSPSITIPITKDSTVANATDAEASKDIRTTLFQEGRQSLQRQTGKRESQCRALIGKFLKCAGDDATIVLKAILQSERDAIADPVAWLNASFTDSPHRRQMKAFTDILEEQKNG